MPDSMGKLTRLLDVNFSLAKVIIGAGVLIEGLDLQ